MHGSLELRPGISPKRCAVNHQLLSVERVTTLPISSTQPVMFCSSDRQSRAARWAVSEWTRQWPW